MKLTSFFLYLIKLRRKCIGQQCRRAIGRIRQQISVVDNYALILENINYHNRLLMKQWLAREWCSMKIKFALLLINPMIYRADNLILLRTHFIIAFHKMWSTILNIRWKHSFFHASNIIVIMKYICIVCQNNLTR